jgi:predicted nucleic acid-binding protein
MSVFFDTNVLVYCTDQKDLAKQAKARALVEQHSASGQAVVSTQVLIELYNVLTNKQKIPKKMAALLIDHYAAWPVVDSDVTLVQNAVSRTLQQPLSIWDAMVIEAASRHGADTLLSEDMGHGQSYGTVTVMNPFA